MKIYTHPSYSYVKVAEILKSEIKKIDFALCKQPRETLAAFYQRQTEKPAIVTNGGFFSMANGNTVFNYKDEKITISADNLYQWGMGITDGNDLIYGNLKSRNWRDFISGYPNLIDGSQKVNINFASEINYKARRTMLGYNDTKIFIVCVESPGMNFTQMQTLMMNLGCKYAINLDGGGSTKMLHNGKSITSTAYNRAVDNVVAIYLKDNTNTPPVTTNNSIYLTPDKTLMTTVGGNTLTIKQKIIPDNTRATKDIASYIKKGELVKPQRKVSDGSGRPRGIVIHNSDSIKVNAATTMAEQYTRATYNGNMGGAVVHYYVTGYNDIWQLLNTEIGQTEQGWHAGDKNTRRNAHTGAKNNMIGGNLDCIAIEVIGDSEEAKQAGAALVAYLCQRHNLDPMIDVYTHNYFMKQPDSIVINAYKNCPLYILPNWAGFLALVNQYYGGKPSVSPNTSNNIKPNTTTDKPSFQVGNVVQFTGSTHYAHSNATTGTTCKPGKAKILSIYGLGKVKHPYSLKWISGGGSTVYGWVDEKDVQHV